MDGGTPCKRKYTWSPEGLAKQRERMRQLNADPEFKSKHRERASERMRQLHADPEFKARASERMRQLHADPEFKSKLAQLNADPEFKARAAERMRQLNADPEFKAKLRASRWRCPPGYEALYRKAVSIIGAKDAREQIEAMALADAERATDKVAGTPA